MFCLLLYFSIFLVNVEICIHSCSHTSSLEVVSMMLKCFFTIFATDYYVFKHSNLLKIFNQVTFTNNFNKSCSVHFLMVNCGEITFMSCRMATFHMVINSSKVFPCILQSSHQNISQAKRCVSWLSRDLVSIVTFSANYLLSQPNSTATRVGSDKVSGWTTTTITQPK